LAIPDGATRPSGRVVLLAPTGLADDPDLFELRDSDPALLAWARTLTGVGLDDGLRARLLGAVRPEGLVDGRETTLSRAAAIVALGARGADDVEAQEARMRAVQSLPVGSSLADVDPSAGAIRGASAQLAALATGGAADPLDDGDETSDPVARDVAVLRLA